VFKNIQQSGDKVYLTTMNTQIKNSTTLLAASCCVFLLWTCSKADIGPEPSPNPVFMVDYQIDSATYSLTAGLQTTYMFTRAELGQDNIWELSGSFADATCPDADCPGSLTFYWRNNDTGNDFDSTWAIGSFPIYYSTPGLPTFQTNLTLDQGSSTPAEVIWTINDSVLLMGKEQVYGNDGSTIRISTEVLDSSGYRFRSSQSFLPAENTFCTRSALRAELDSSMLNLRVTPLGTGSFTFLWNSGETTQSIRVPFNPVDTYSVTVTNTAGGCTAMAAFDQLPAFFSVIESGFVNAAAVRVIPGGPIIEWIDPQGDAWRSDRIAQQPFPVNFFQILELEDYLENENGLPTRKLRVAWSCRVYNEAGASRGMSGEGVIGMGWPK